MKKQQSGSLSITVLVFVSIFVMVFVGLATLSLSQSRVQRNKEQGLTALEIAEAGFDYYKWFLAHSPDDMQDGTGQAGPYVHDYVDPETSSLGKFSLQVSGDVQCGKIARVDITSTGWMNENPSLKKVIYGSYARPSAASYSYITEASVLAGPDRVVYGPFHSNGGVNFQGHNFSSVTSKLPTWDCTSDYDCSPRNPNAPGVMGTGGSQSFWRWPVPNIDFSILSQNISNVYSESIAKATPSVCTAGQTLGCFFPRVSGTTGKGYHAIMKANGTF
ncbi:MAG: pilus assembly PilX N-terminal domain-containing protein, partial [Candidatus Parcubacteria bacterium]|nr:pilus assembly PilX N-terminal domain-containing protein [Candidatus Parcubacteria bacterium]